VNALAIGSFALAAGIAFGAFGAHALGDVGPDRTRWWTTGSHYHLIAAIGLMVLGLLQRQRPTSSGPGWVLLAGLVLFSGSLYAMTLGAPRALGAVTPLGGMCLMAGFAWLGVLALGR
jgi:uncharacterized membrane protein YgdD (TMEM256/DUF423 family)